MSLAAAAAQCPSCGSCPSCALRLRRLWMRLWRRRKRPCGWRCLPVVQCTGGAAAGKPERTADVSPLQTPATPPPAGTPTPAPRTWKDTKPSTSDELKPTPDPNTKTGAPPALPDPNSKTAMARPSVRRAAALAVSYRSRPSRVDEEDDGWRPARD